MIIVPLAIFISVLLSSPASTNIHAFKITVEYGEWEMIKNKDGVQTYVRSVTDNKGVSVRERKGEMSVNCSQQDAVQLLADAGSTMKWMSGVDENYYLSRVSQSEWYTYTLFSIPWPFKQRDLVSQYKMASDPSHRTVSIAIVSKDHYAPAKPGITRLTDYRATWVITKLGEKNVKISFNAISSAPLIFPRLIQDPVIENIFHNNLVRLKEVLSIQDQ